MERVRPGWQRWDIKHVPGGAQGEAPTLPRHRGIWGSHRHPELRKWTWERPRWPMSTGQGASKEERGRGLQKSRGVLTTAFKCLPEQTSTLGWGRGGSVRSLGEPDGRILGNNPRAHMGQGTAPASTRQNGKPSTHRTLSMQPGFASETGQMLLDRICCGPAIEAERHNLKR